MPPALVGFKDDSAVKTSSSVTEISLRVNTGVGKSSMDKPRLLIIGSRDVAKAAQRVRAASHFTGGS